MTKTQEETEAIIEGCLVNAGFFPLGGVVHGNSEKLHDAVKCVIASLRSEHFFAADADDEQDAIRIDFICRGVIGWPFGFKNFSRPLFELKSQIYNALLASMQSGEGK